MRLTLALAFVLVLSRCTVSPDGVLFRCEAGDSCPTGFTCRSIGDGRYCVAADGGAVGGGASGGSIAGGAAAGGTAGGIAGGSVAGGGAGGSVGGGSVGGGSVGGGSVGGGITGGGVAGGSVGGGIAGGGVAGGSVAGGSVGGGSVAGGIAGGGVAGGSVAGGGAGGSGGGGSTDGGSTDGGSTDGGDTSRDAGYTQLAVIPNSRFLGIAQVALAPAPPTPVVATVRETLDGGPSILEGWSVLGGAPTQSRTVSGLRVQAIASNSNGNVAIGGLTNNAVEVDYVWGATGFGTIVAVPIETRVGDAGVTRLRMLETPTNAGAVFIGGGSTPDVARLYRVSTSPMLTHAVDSNQAFALGDDVVHSPTSTAPNRLLVVARCDGSCTFNTAGAPATGATSHRYGWTEYDATSFGPPSRFANIAGAGGPVFDGQQPVRAASEGTAAFTFFGQGGAGELVVERRDADTGSRLAIASSTGTLALVDVLPVGTLTFALAVANGPVDFGSTTLPYTPGNLRNVVLIRVAVGGALTAFTWDVPGDQLPVGFAAGSNGSLYLAINQGPDAVLWRVPVP